MLILLNDYDDAAKELLQSLRTARIDVVPVVIRYGGELPSEALCPIAEYAGLPRTGEPLFFNEVPVPPWCEIRQGKEAYGEVLRDGETLARIHYEAGTFRQVADVDWLLGDGSVSHTDHYDRYGSHYATTWFDGGAAYQTVYRGSGQFEVEVDLGSRAVVLRSPGRTLTFPSLTDLVSHYLDERGLGAGVGSGAEAGPAGGEVLINSLSYPLFVQRQRAGAAPSTTLFWQEPMPGDVPGNMALELDEPRALRRIVFEDERLLHKVAAAHPDTAVELTYLSHIGQFAEKAGFEPARTFTLTHTDELPGLEELLARFPHVTFSVAALTQMSEKLHDLERRFGNLHLTPTINQSGIADELARASVYLDLNAGRQVLDVVKAAYYLNLVVLAPSSQAKLPDFSLTFPSMEALASRLADVMASDAARAAALDEQHRLRGPLSTAADYRRLFGG